MQGNVVDFREGDWDREMWRRVGWGGTRRGAAGSVWQPRTEAGQGDRTALQSGRKTSLLAACPNHLPNCGGSIVRGLAHASGAGEEFRASVFRV